MRTCWVAPLNGATRGELHAALHSEEAAKILDAHRRVEIHGPIGPLARPARRTNLAPSETGRLELYDLSRIEVALRESR